MISAEQIRSLLEKATKGLWKVHHDHGHCFEVKSGSEYVVQHLKDEEDAAFIAALPDIAQTALDALARVEELEKALRGVENSFEDDTGLCRDCGGTLREKDSCSCNRKSEI